MKFEAIFDSIAHPIQTVRRIAGSVATLRALHTAVDTHPAPRSWAEILEARHNSDIIASLGSTGLREDVVAGLTSDHLTMAQLAYRTMQDADDLRRLDP